MQIRKFINGFLSLLTVGVIVFSQSVFALESIPEQSAKSESLTVNLYADEPKPKPQIPADKKPITVSVNDRGLPPSGEKVPLVLEICCGLTFLLALFFGRKCKKVEKKG